MFQTLISQNNDYLTSPTTESGNVAHKGEQSHAFSVKSGKKKRHLDYALRSIRSYER